MESGARVDDDGSGLDWLLLDSKFFLMETSRCTGSCASATCPSPAWFDCPENGASGLTQVIVKDGDDVHTPIAVVAGQIMAVGAMMIVDLLREMAWGWQLTTRWAGH
ncbi:hypothetical protein AZE42_01576 [Rhizopogon vesiculosus]|uniref:Uncharacterized protein n=1 Tax=Rhizopogon vesiculosus TaxID=180088 RepID=A0A1J8QLN5_9AGAM|nr:hypothetical protein AZE42_01576 [Rhizopogon vesiculosus]